MISFKNIENYTGIYLGDVSIIEVYSGEYKVWPDKEEPLKFKRIRQDGTVYKLECDENGTLTSLETRGDLTSADISGTSNPVTAITIGDCVTEIGDGAFNSWSKVTGDLVIPDNVTRIGDYAFGDCSGLKGTLTLGTGITEIGGGAFQNCNNFTGELVIPDNVTTIGYGAFRNCWDFTGTLRLGTGITEIGGDAFYQCSSFTGNLVIPNSVKTIGGSAFRSCIGFTGKLVIPDNVTTIGYDAFAYCYGLTSVTIGTGVTLIDGTAFNQCTNLTAIYCKATTPPTLGSGVFENTNNCPIYVPCDSVDAYKAADNWSTYADRIVGWDFENDDECPEQFKFKRISQDGTRYKLECDENGTLTSGDTRGNLTMDDISGDTNPVTSITIGDCVTEIGGRTFCGWTKVTGELVIPTGVTIIGENAFYNCKGFNGTLTLPTGLTKIDNYVFYSCSGFTGELVIPDGVMTIGDGVFAQCTGFNGTLTLPTGVTRIDDNAFYNCRGFTGDLIIPDKVTRIGYDSFGSCTGFTSVTIGTGITSIDKTAFGYCNKLTAIYCKATTPPTLGVNPFNATNNCPIYVPCESVNAYKSASDWSDYVDRIVGWDFENDGECPEEGFKLERFYSDGHSDKVPCNDSPNLTQDETKNDSYADVTGITIGDCVERIYPNAFSGWTNLQGDILIPENVTSLGDRVFTGCKNIENITCSVDFLGSYVFSGCTNLKTVTFEKPLYTVNTGNFLYTGPLVRVHCNDYAQTYKVISGNTTRVVIIEEGCLPDNTKFARYFNDGTQYYYITTANTEDLSVQKSYTGSTQTECKSRTTALTITDKVVSIGAGSFSGWTNLQKVVINARNTSNNSFSGCTKIRRLTFGDNVTNINNSSFYNTGPDVVVIPDNVVYIGERAFAMSDMLGKVTLGAGLTEIGNQAFIWCAALEEVHVKATTPPSIGYEVFPSKTTIYVPSASVDAYKAAPGWSDYASTIKAEMN